ncbi:unnamed protein product [Hermetia illucens]|uniref:Uncharacterized protein n=3 Tax=Hermetia illucens TaxID=343691 RepID=A0A7R8V3N9_HERIL|nr:unnamed protein product [Hermetia illucens]
MSISITENACRVCLVEQEIMINLFDTVEDFQKQRLSDLLENCSDLKIDQSDNQPKLICDECTGELLVAAKFHAKCRRTLEILSQVQQAIEENKTTNDEDIAANEVNDVEDALHTPVDVDSIIIEEHEMEDEGVEADQNSSQQDKEDLMFEEVGYVEEDMNNDQIILYEPDVIEEHLSPKEQDSEEHHIEQDTMEYEEQNVFEKIAVLERKKSLRTTVAPRPLIINCKCDVCGAGFTHVNNLNRHIQTHNPEEIFTCSICKYPFTTYLALENHSSEHQKDADILERDLREENYETKENILGKAESPPIGKCDTDKLVATVSASEEPRRTKICDICNKPFVSKSALEAHIRTHTGDRPFKCDVCPKAFKTQGGLALHLRRHLGVRPYVCNVCNKSFGESSNLRVHMRTHTGEKPHKCTICNRSFARVFLLQIHLRTHTGERPYQCPFCDKAFAQGGDLASHKRTHTGERPHVCPYCKRGFIKSSGLTQHMRKHVNQEARSEDAVHNDSDAEVVKGSGGIRLFIVGEEDASVISENEGNDDNLKDIKVEDYVIEFNEDIET